MGLEKVPNNHSFSASAPVGQPEKINHRLIYILRAGDRALKISELVNSWITREKMKIVTILMGINIIAIMIGIIIGIYPLVSSNVAGKSPWPSHWACSQPFRGHFLHAKSPISPFDVAPIKEAPKMYEVYVRTMGQFTKHMPLEWFTMPYNFTWQSTSFSSTWTDRWH